MYRHCVCCTAGDTKNLVYFRLQSNLKGVMHSNLKQYIPRAELELAGDLADYFVTWKSTRLIDVWFDMARNVFTIVVVACIATSWGCERRVYIGCVLGGTWREEQINGQISTLQPENIFVVITVQRNSWTASVDSTLR